ncbi:hypothetical protein CKY47_08400 [Saccharothrix yanglingensis]|uniref:P-type ATPase A domain-containing protein n=1 Tax=Saccharothrix yanglingensis TaxID=659496 RepID=A0ABU0WWW9_9PSEU|nr:hypothetical protein [Saccharothrix yanglingensis]
MVRDGAVAEVDVGAVVADDLLELRAGDQVVADGAVVASDRLEVDESLLTGESDPVLKAAGDDVRSGSVVVAGTGRARATGVGDQAHAARLTAEARRFSAVRSELVTGTNRVAAVDRPGHGRSGDRCCCGASSAARTPVRGRRP